MAGSARNGGVLLVAGDDHPIKSSTSSHQCEYPFMDAMIPVLSPAGVQEFLDLGIYGWALSRYSGCWVGFKVIAETAESSASCVIDPQRISIQLPGPDDFEMPAAWSKKHASTAKGFTPRLPLPASTASTRS